MRSITFASVFVALLLGSPCVGHAAPPAAPPAPLPARNAEAEAARIGTQWVTTTSFLDQLAMGKATSPFLPARGPLIDKVDAARKNATTVQHPWGGEGANRFMRLRVKKTDRKRSMTDLRDCLAVPLVGRIDYEVEILPGSELRVATDFVGAGRGRARLRVLAIDGKKETVLIDEETGPKGLWGSTWDEQFVSLAALAGKKVTLRFEVDDPAIGEGRWNARGSAQGVGLFAVPRIVTKLTAKDTALRGRVKARVGDEMNRSVMAIFFDSFRADLVPPVREERKIIPSITPNLDAFFGKATRFSRTFSVGNQTRTGSYGFLTSLPPSAAGWWQTRWEFDDKAREKFYGGKVSLLTAELRKKGYLVGMMGFNGFLNGGTYLALDMGFDFVAEFNGVPENTIRMTDGVSEFLDKYKDEKVFLLVWYEPPHFPYSPPPGYIDQIHAAGVDKELKFFAHGFLGKMRYGDEHFGRLIAHATKVGFLDKAITFITGDHGECMDPRHDGYSDNVNTRIARMHGKTFFDEEVHIPFALRMPGVVPENKTVTNQVSLMDVGPTVLELLGMRPAVERQMGRSFAGLARGGTEPDTRTAYFEGRWSAGFREGGLKYLFHERDEKLRFNNPDLFSRSRDGQDELYRVSKDPFELTNLASTESGTKNKLRARYAALRAEMVKLYRAIGHTDAPPRPIAPFTP